MFISTAHTTKGKVRADWLEKFGLESSIKVTLGYVDAIYFTIDEAKTLLFELESALKDAYENEMAASHICFTDDSLCQECGAPKALTVVS
jgi:hypothetical protein